MMFKRTALFILLISFLALAVSPEKDEPYIQFIAGIMMIKSNPRLTNVEIATRFSELEAICGINGKQAIEFIRKFRDNPQDWKKISEKVQKVIVENTSGKE